MSPHSFFGSSWIPLSVVLVLSALSSRVDLVGWWTFDEGSGTTAADSSPEGSSHPASLQSGASFIAGGKFEGAVTLDGVNDIVCEFR